MAISSDYIHWPLNNKTGLTALKHTNVADTPDLVFTGVSGVWSTSGWATANGSDYATTEGADNGVLLDLMRLDTLADTDILLVAAWVDSDAWGVAGSLEQLVSFGATANIDLGFQLRLTESTLWSGEAYELPTNQFQSRISGGNPYKGDSTFQGAALGEGPQHLLFALRNIDGYISKTLFQNGIDNKGTDVLAPGRVEAGFEQAVWDNAFTGSDKGLNLFTARNSSGGTNGILSSAYRMRDLLVVRSTTDQWVNIDSLARDLYDNDGGIPASWDAL